MFPLYKKFTRCLSVTAALSALLLPAYGQNTPVLNTTAPAGTATIISIPPTLLSGTEPAYIRSFSPKVPVTDANALTLNSPASDVQVNTSYKDGFNRTVQSVVHNFSTTPVLRHLIQPYDTRFQKDQYGFLPFLATAHGFDAYLFTNQYVFNTGFYSGEDYTSYSVTKNTSDANQRSVKSFAPGKSQVGQGRGTMAKKVSNTANEVRIWNLDANGKPVSSTYYPANELFGELKQSSDGAEVLTYTDKDGRVVSRREYLKDIVNGQTVTAVYGTTYFVYDELGNLRYMLPPKATDLSPTGTPSLTVLDKLCFQYTYDSKGNKITQKVPGKNVEYFVYDKRGRVVYYQDGNLAPHKWTFNIYDALNRINCTGIFTSTTQTQQSLQASFNDNTTYPSPINLVEYQKNYDQYKVYPASIPQSEILAYTYYDDYSIIDPASGLWGTYSSDLQFGGDLLSVPGAETPARSNRTQGMITGSKVKIMPAPGITASTTGDWRETVNFYDDKGRVIYTVSKDLYGGNAIHAHFSGTQYGFSGNVLISKHIAVNALSNDGVHTEWARNVYDNTTGRITQTLHRIGTTGTWNITSVYAYDELGRVKRKVLGNYGEVQDYSYNIRGQLTGINDYYARTGNRQGESRSFGQTLRYDYGFTQPKYDGSIAGMIWRGAGGASANAYGYTYERGGRLALADYRKLEGATWTKANADYTVSNITYDLNGNLKSMDQRAVKPGTGPVDMDKLVYSYEDAELSNRLLKVVDNAAFQDLGDFNNTNGSSNDYSYDVNGNLLADANKSIIGTTYTIFNKPQVVSFSGGRTITYSYDAAGNKVQEVVNNGTTTKKTDYIGNFVYENNELQYALTADGRSVYKLDNQTFKEEFLVKDHLGNIRSVVDVYNYPVQEYLASYEIASANLENLFFDNIDDVRDDRPGSTWNGDLKSARLNGADPERRIGTSALLKVMAGDKVELNVNNYYENYSPEQDQPVNMEDMLSTLVNTLTEGAGGFVGSESHNAALIDDAFSWTNFNLFNTGVSTVTDPNRPKAYLNYILFDEQMKIQSSLSGAIQANGNGTWTQIGTTAPVEIPINGYLAVYLSNASQSIACLSCSDVFFDQLVIRFSRGSLKEETHYYPHGLPMAGMGSAAAGFEENKRRYQSNEYNKDLGLNWMDFNFRQYDPQIGRFLSVDPLASSTLNLSPYVAMNNNPVSLTDPDGLIADAPKRKGENEGFVHPGIAEWMDAEWIGILFYMNQSRFGGMDWDGGRSMGVQNYTAGNIIRSFERSMGFQPISFAGFACNLGSVGGSSDGPTTLLKRGGLFGWILNGIADLFMSGPAPAWQMLAYKGVGTFSINDVKAIAKTEKKERKDQKWGSYTITFDDGHKYHGKGPFKRMAESAIEKMVKYGVMATSMVWTPSATERDAFKDEYRRMQTDRSLPMYPEGYQNPINYNIIQSWGKLYLEQDDYGK